MKTRIILALAMTVSIAGLAAAQQEVSVGSGGGFTYTRFYRVHLRNGNCIDGDLVGKTDLQVTLRLSYGEIHIRRNQIDRIEFVKMKSWNEPEVLIDKRKKQPETPQDINNANTPPKPAENTPPAEAADSAEAAPSNIASSVVEAVDLTISVWKRTPSAERQDLTDALVALGAPAVPYLEFLLEKRAKSTPLDQVAKALATINEDRFIEICPKLLTSRIPAMRAAAVAALGRTTSTKRLPVLLDALDDSDPTVGQQALEGVMAWAKSDADKRDVADLIAQRLRKSKNPMILADALSKLGGRAAHDALWDLANDSDERNRQIGIVAVSQMGDAEDGPKMHALLRDTSLTIRKAACLAVGKMKYPAAVADLVNMLSEDNEGLQKNVRWALQAITGAAVPDTNDGWKEWWLSFGSKEPRFNQ